ncbi:hypothetical protein PU63_11785 [Escherichia coli]|nr:hypothetical protein PU63_11785 [Escherichia coli]KIG46047.1 hypothetical protein PU64_09455 [Escherichia coli]
MERILADYRGSWSLIRLLEQAQVTPVDSSTFKVVWKAQDGLPLNYLLRVEQGKSVAESLCNFTGYEGGTKSVNVGGFMHQ